MSIPDMNFYSVVIRLPEDPKKRGELLTVLRIESEFMGGTVTAASQGDVITELEQLEVQLED